MTTTTVKVKEPADAQATSYIDNEDAANASSPTGFARRQRVAVYGPDGGPVDASISRSPVVVDANNTTTDPLAADGVFEGDATDISNYAQINVNIYAEPSTAKASWWFEFSVDGTNWDTTVPSLVRDPTFVIPVPLINTGARWFRARYLNDGGAAAIAALGLDETPGTPVDQDEFRFSVALLPQATKELARTLDQTIQGSDAVSLTRSVIMGKTAAGGYANVELTEQRDLRVGFNAARLDDLCVAAEAIGVGATFETPFVSVKDFAALKITPDVDELIQGYTEWSVDGSTVHHNYTTPFVGAGDFSVPVGAEFVRIRATNLAAATATFSAEVFGLYQPPGLFLFPAAAPIDGSFPAALVKAVVTGQQPDGGYESLRLPGSDEGNSTAANLPANDSFVGAAFDTTGFLGGMVLVKASHQSASDGVRIEFSESPTFTAVNRTITATYDNTSNGLPVFFPVMQGEYFRVRYTNGPTTTTSLLIRTELFTEQAQTPLGGLASTSIDDHSLAAMVRGVLVAKGAGGAYGNIGRGAGGGLDVGVVEHETDTPIRAGDDWGVTKVTATTAAAVLFTTPADCVSVEVFNADNNVNLRINKTVVDVDGGQYRTVLPGNSVVLEIGPGIDIAGAAASSSISAEFTVILDTSV